MTWLAFQGPLTLLFVLGGFVLHIAVSLLSILAMRRIAERFPEPCKLVTAALAMPFSKEPLRFVGVRAFVLEMPRVGYEDSCIPRASHRPGAALPGL